MIELLPNNYIQGVILTSIAVVVLSIVSSVKPKPRAVLIFISFVLALLGEIQKFYYQEMLNIKSAIEKEKSELKLEEMNASISDVKRLLEITFEKEPDVEPKFSSFNNNKIDLPLLKYSPTELVLMSECEDKVLIYRVLRLYSSEDVQVKEFNNLTKVFSCLDINNTLSYSNGLKLEKDGGKFGYKNKDGFMVIENKFELAGKFSEGYAFVKINEKWGYINVKGNLVIPCQYDYAWGFNKGKALVEKNGIRFFINVNGEKIEDS